jgi:hypothetical protein
MMEQVTASTLARRRQVVFIMSLFLWFIWAAILFGSFFFVIVIAINFAHPEAAPERVPDPKAMNLLFVIALVGGAATISAMRAVRFFILRAAVRKWSWVALAVAYPACKVLTWSVCNGALYFCLVLCLIGRSFLPAFPLAAVIWFCIVADPPLIRPFKKYESIRYEGAFAH